MCCFICGSETNFISAGDGDFVCIECNHGSADSGKAALVKKLHLSFDFCNGDEPKVNGENLLCFLSDLVDALHKS